MYSNNNIIIRIRIINKKINKRKKRKKKAKNGVGEKRASREDFILFLFSSFRFFLRSIKIGPQVLVWTEGKDDLCDESYVWTPKSWSFIKLHEVGNFPTYVISNLKTI